MKIPTYYMPSACHLHNRRPVLNALTLAVMSLIMTVMTVQTVVISAALRVCMIHHVRGVKHERVYTHNRFRLEHQPMTNTLTKRQTHGNR